MFVEYNSVTYLLTILCLLGLRRYSKMPYGFVHRCCGLFAAGLLMASLPAAASLITFTNRAAFEAATTGLTNLTFEGIVPTDSAQDFPNPAGLTTDGITFRTSGTGPFGAGVVSVYGLVSPLSSLLSSIPEPVRFLSGHRQISLGRLSLMYCCPAAKQRSRQTSGRSSRL